jgi:hypothetical protein
MRRCTRARAAWMTVMLGLLQVVVASDGSVLPLVGRVVEVAQQMVCAARHLMVPWGINGASESQLSR